MIHSRGFTLAETLVVIAIVSVVSIAITRAIQYFYQSNAFLLEQTAALDSARQGMLDTVHALREASYGDDGSYPIAAAGTSTVTFYSDINNTGSVAKVRYYLQGTTLYRGMTKSAGSPPSYAGQAESTATIATYVRNPATTPIFTYFDVNGQQLSTTSPNVAQISSVGLNVEIDLNPNRAPNIFTLTESATLRNLRLAQ